MNTLDLLADRYGIEASFRNARGEVQTTAPATRQALLAAMGAQADTVTREATQVNVPATSTEHANWRRRLSMSLQEIIGDSGFQALARMLNELRPSPEARL
jgi:4-alpha-glucanotransferase